MNENEKELHRELVKKGYKVLRNGWPDFLVIPPNKGKIFAMELKYGRDKVSPDQKKMHKALEEAGLEVRVHQVVPPVAKPKKAVSSKKLAPKDWLGVIEVILDSDGGKMNTGDIEARIASRYPKRVKGIKNLHGSVGSALARVREGVVPRIKCGKVGNHRYVYWTVK